MAAAAAACRSTCGGHAHAFIPSTAWYTSLPRSSVFARGTGAASVSSQISLSPRQYAARSSGRRAGACQGVLAMSSVGGYASSRGLVFPTEIEEGWFDSATVGAPRVHRCETEWTVMLLVSLKNAFCVF